MLSSAKMDSEIMSGILYQQFKRKYEGIVENLGKGSGESIVHFRAADYFLECDY